MMNEKELQDVFLALLREALTGDVAPILDGIEWTNALLGALYELSVLHDMAHLVATALNRRQVKITGEEAEGFRKQAMLSVYRTETIDYEYEALCDVLDEANISYLPLKGSVLRPYYPKASMRTSCDIDILVKEAELEQAAQVIVEKNGYTAGEKNIHDMPMDSPSGVHFELHFLLEEGQERVDKLLAKVWDFAHNDGGAKYQLSNDFLLFYHFAHMAKHFRHGGCGLRPFLDLWVMEHCMGINRHCADTLLEQAGLKKFAQGMFLVTDVWLAGKEKTDLTERIQDYLMYAGTYGSRENFVMTARVRNGKFRLLFHKVFLSYRQMLGYYPSLRKCPILYPFYQVRRWCRILFCGGMKRVKRQFRYIRSVGEEHKEKVNTLYDALGF